MLEHNTRCAEINRQEGWSPITICRRVRASQEFVQQIKVRVADLGVLPVCLLGEDY
jgi:hypothetical protein